MVLHYLHGTDNNFMDFYLKVIVEEVVVIGPEEVIVLKLYGRRPWFLKFTVKGYEVYLNFDLFMH